jgi:hypothetical protein
MRSQKSVSASARLYAQSSNTFRIETVCPVTDLFVRNTVKFFKFACATAAGKLKNRKISSVRILAEHAIGVKRCRIVKERFRCTKFGFDDTVMLIACGLHNFRISLKYNTI